ncbi:MAG: glycosyltransferase [Bacteroidales bacterium]
MNVLYCGDKNIEDGLIISVLSLIEHTKEELNVYVMTAQFSYKNKEYLKVGEETVSILRQYLKKANQLSDIKLLDITQLFKSELPTANMRTRFTPCCMLRLLADRVEELPDKLLYLDNDVVCRKSIDEFYNQDISDVEFVGILDHYGSWLFRKKPFKRNYVNSGVLLMNLSKIRETGLFKKALQRCKEKRMFMPDQTAINHYVTAKRLAERKFNEQRRMRADTVMRHYTTTFRFFPWFHHVYAKPWQIDRMHKLLKDYEFDHLFQEYSKIKMSIVGCEQSYNIN